MGSTDLMPHAPVRMVTVSSTYGAGGAAIAPLLADRLGLPFADRLIHSHGALPHSEEGVTEAEVDEEPGSPLLRSLALLSPAWSFPTPVDPGHLPERMRETVEDSIRALVEAGGAVILGRAAAVVIGRRPWAYHVRLDGPKDRRARRGAAWEGVDLETARARLAATDATRARYTRRLYGRDSDDPALYHLLLDTTVLTVEACVELLADAAREFWAYDDDHLEAAIARSRARLAQRGPD